MNLFHLPVSRLNTSSHPFTQISDILSKYPKKILIASSSPIKNEFAKRFALTDRQAYNYIRHHQGVEFIENNYGIIHTLDFNEAVDSVAVYCRRHGGKL